jgi:hypothetical protein
VGGEVSEAVEGDLLIMHPLAQLVQAQPQRVELFLCCKRWVVCLGDCIIVFARSACSA